MFQLDARVLGFEHLRALYVEDEDFGEFKAPQRRFFFIQEGFLFEGTRLCVLRYSTRELLIKKVHGGSLLVIW